jgi:hypothetical protein
MTRDEATRLLDEARRILARAAQGRDLDEVTRALLRASTEVAKAQRALAVEQEARP